MSIYLDRYAYAPLNISTLPDPNVGIIVVIPVFKEKNTLTALNSLLASALPNKFVEVLIIINQSENCDDTIAQQNQDTLNEVEAWIKLNQKEGISFYTAFIKLPKKHAGVGLARKAGMDEAARRFEKINNEQGIILCFDADCTCNSNYLQEVYTRFKQQKLKGASIYFEHTFEQLSIYKIEGITQYELHLRHYINGLRKAGYPYAFHTVGSSMAVRTDIYKKAGGMNRRKAGEDFHFLHKVIPYGHYDEITTTTVFPSARISDRVPFGTGRAMKEWTINGENIFYSYHPLIFKGLAELLKLVPLFYTNISIDLLVNKLSPNIQAYLKNEHFEAVLKDINRQSSSIKTFINRWFDWFNGLRVLHFVHYLRDNSYASIPVCQAAGHLINSEHSNSTELLREYRKMDKEFTAGQISLKHLYSEHL